MSRLIKTGSIAGDRNRLMRGIALTLRELMIKGANDQQTQDMVAFIILALDAVTITVDKTVLPWEKRDYWLKADQFRRDWAWAARAANELSRAVDQEPWAWDDIPPVLAQISQHVADVQIPTRHRLGTPWEGGWRRYRESGRVSQRDTNG